MVRYIMSFTAAEGRQDSVQKVIDTYFDALHKQGPGGMRSQCYAENDDESNFVHIKSFKKESVANHHFKSAIFRDYIEKLAVLCNGRPGFSRLHQQQTFESIY